MKPERIVGRTWKRLSWLLFLAPMFSAWACLPSPASAQAIVPGTGQKVDKVGDDLEDPKWIYRYNLPKSSHENDDQQRLPGGGSANGRWSEGVKRGQPDQIERVSTPDGGIPGSQGALLMRSKQTGVPGVYSRAPPQNDLIITVSSRLGSAL